MSPITATLRTAALTGLAVTAACSGGIMPAGSGNGPAPPAPGIGTRPGPMMPPTQPGSPQPDPPGPEPVPCEEGVIRPGPSTVRRLTRFEYNNTVRDLLGDTTAPADALPAEDLGNGFGNDSGSQAVSSLLAEQYARLAEQIAARATGTAAALGSLAPCAATVTAATEETCARSLIEGLAPRAFRRPLAGGELDQLLGLFGTVRAQPGGTFASAAAAVVELVLQSPEFLYRLEFGVADPARPELRRPTGDEMATRLSYLLWGTAPDGPLRAAARTGELLTAEGVLAQARRLLADARSHPVVRLFFDNLLPINALPDLERDRALYPTFTPALGAAMREETQLFLEHEIFENDGSWASALTATHSFVNPVLAAYYGLPAITGEGFRKVPLDTSKRLGLLTHASVMAGTTHSNHTNPVVRGAFIANKLLCIDIPLPDASIADRIKPPDPYTGKTARERYTKHREDPVCAGCHAAMDPIGLALENYDAVGLYRTQENGVTIDATGAVPGADGTVNSPVQLVKQLAATEAAHSCFAGHWLKFAYGRTLGPGDTCLKDRLSAAFKRSGYNVRQLLLALTQTDDFLYLPVQKEGMQ
jgi:hypothetical protein